MVNEWLCARFVSPLRFVLQERQYSVNCQCILHEQCILTKKVLSMRSLVGFYEKRSFELWYSVGMYLVDRQKSRRGSVLVCGLAV